MIASVTSLMLIAFAADPPARVADRNTFALDLMKQLAPARGSGNVVVSPQGVTRVMAMAAEGASGETAKEIRKAAKLPGKAQGLAMIDPARPMSRPTLNLRVVANEGYGLKVEAVPPDSESARAGLEAGDLILTIDDRPVRSLEALKNALDPPEGRKGPARVRVYAFATGEVLDHSITTETIEAPSPFASKDGVFVQKGPTIRPEFLAVMDRSFGAKIVPLDFASDPAGSANQIARFTTGAPPADLASIDASTRMVLIDVSSFEADWRNPFPPESPGPFTRPDGRKIEVPFLSRTGRYPVAELPDGARVVEIPYADDSFSLIVTLPGVKLSPRSWLAGLSAESFESLRSSLKAKKVDLSLPRFRVEATHDLKPHLMAMGMTLAFGPRADFSNVAAIDPSDRRSALALRTVVQSSYLEITPKGTRAGATTTATAVALGVEDEPIPFHADRPFAFFLVDRRTGLIAFAGVVDDPSRSR